MGLTVAGLVAISVLLRQSNDPQSSPIFNFSLSISIFLLIVAFWAYTTQTPKTSKGRIGIAVAIVSEDETEGKQIQFDLVNTLRQLLARSPFTVSDLPKSTNGYAVRGAAGRG